MVETPIQIRFSDVDLAGHVHNAIYLGYFEQGRMDFFYKMLTQEAWDWKKQSLILARNEIDYKAPVYLHDKIVVRTRFESYGTKSLTLSYQLVRGETVCAEGISVLVCYDYSKNGTIDIPQVWQKRLDALLN